MKLSQFHYWCRKFGKLTLGWPRLIQYVVVLIVFLSIVQYIIILIFLTKIIWDVLDFKFMINFFLLENILAMPKPIFLV